MSPHESIDALNQTAWELSRKDAEQALARAEQAYALAQEKHYAKGQAHALTNLARINHYQGENTKALSLAMEALTAFETLHLRDEMYLHNLDTVGTVLVTLGSYAEALDICLKLLKAAEDFPHPHYRAWTLNHIGVIYLKMNDFPKALECFTQCLPLSQEIGHVILTAGLHGNIAETQYKMGQLNPALQMATAGLQIARQIPDSDLELFLMLTIGEIYTRMEAYDEALDYFQNMLQIIDRHPPIRVRHHSMGALYNRGLIFVKLGRLDEGAASFQNMLEMAIETGEKARQYMGHEQLAHLYEQQGDFPRALHHYREFHRIKEEVFGLQNAARVNSMIVLHETENARKEAESYRLQAEVIEKDRQYFERLSQMKDDLLHSASHDLKNPLATIKTYTYLLRRQLPDAAAHLERYIDRIEDSTEQMRTLIQNLLELAAIEAQHSLAKQPVALSPLLQQVIHEFDEQTQAMTMRFFPAAVEIAANPELLRRLFQNLLSNAVKYTPAGGTIEVKILNSDTQVHVIVKDTGIGISADDLPHIFDKFYRIEDNLHLAAEGTGLGLAIAKEIAEQHGGTIHARSTPGAGSEFEVVLPLS